MGPDGPTGPATIWEIRTGGAQKSSRLLQSLVVLQPQLIVLGGYAITSIPKDVSELTNTFKFPPVFCSA